MLSLNRPSTSSQSPNHDRPAKLHCRGTVPVEQSSGSSMETRDDTAHFQATTQSLSVPHLMCRRTEGTSTAARHCCGIFRDTGTAYKFADLLTYLLTMLYLEIKHLTEYTVLTSAGSEASRLRSTFNMTSDLRWPMVDGNSWFTHTHTHTINTFVQPNYFRQHFN